jgi:quinol monooxygenase YgiN
MFSTRFRSAGILRASKCEVKCRAALNREPAYECRSSLKGETDMVTVALWVKLEAKKGKESDVESFLKGGLAIVQEEPATTAWFAIRLGPTTFGIFDAFPDEAGRQAHLTGRVAAALMARAGELLAQPPSIEKVDVLAAKLPGKTSQAGA